MKAEAHRLIAKIACQTVKRELGIQLPTNVLVGDIMAPDRESILYKHRYEEDVAAEFNKFLGNLIDDIHKRGPVKPWPDYSYVIHLLSDFCCLPHAPHIQKTRGWESQYEGQINAAAREREAKPCSRAIEWYRNLNGSVNLSNFIEREIKAHWSISGILDKNVESDPSEDLEQAIFVASATMLALCGKQAKTRSGCAFPALACIVIGVTIVITVARVFA